MRILFLTAVASLFAISSFGQEISYPEEQNLRSDFKLKISNISEKAGEIRIAVFDSEESYDSKENPLHKVVLDVTADSLVWHYEELPYGEYAIAVYHDKNENGELDTNLLGIPKEAYGFSNNARGRFGPAKWENAHFKVNSELSTMTIEVK